MVGSLLVWGPPAVYHIATGDPVAGGFLLVDGTIVVGALRATHDVYRREHHQVSEPATTYGVDGVGRPEWLTPKRTALNE
jgi:hypothetical protein